MHSFIRSILLIFSSFLFMAVSCEIEEDEESMSINRNTVLEGHLFKSCEQTEVYAHLDLFFYEKQGFNLSGDKIKYLGTTRTNDAGYYRFDVGSCTNGKDIEVNDGNGDLLFTTACAGDVGYINYDRASGFAHIENPLKIMTDSSFSDLDTLYVGFIGASTTVSVFGPFENGQVINSGNILKPIPPGGLISMPIGVPVTSNAFWGIGKANFECARFFSGCRNNTNFIPVSQKVCQMGDTIYLDLSLARNWASL